MEHGSKPAGAIDVIVRKPGGQAIIAEIQKTSGPMKAAGRNFRLRRAVMQYIKQYIFRSNLDNEHELKKLIDRNRWQNSSDQFSYLWHFR